MATAREVRAAEGPLSVEVVTAYESIAAEWRALADRVRQPFFHGPDWVELLHGSFAAGRPLVVTARRQDQLCGVLPLDCSRHALRSYGLAHTPECALLADDDETISALVSLAAGEKRLLALEGIRLPEDRLHTIAAPTLTRRVRVRTLGNEMQPFVETHGDWDSYWSARSKNLRSDLNRRGRRLEDAHEVKHDVVTAVDARLEEALEVEGSGWKAREGTAILSTPTTRDFYRAAARWAAARGMLRLGLLRADDRLIAFELGVLDRGVLYTLKGGFDERFAEFAPGVQLIARTIRESFNQGYRRYEFLGSPEPYKLRWATGTRSLVSLWAGRSLAAYVEIEYRTHVRPAVRRYLRARPGLRRTTLRIARATHPVPALVGRTFRR